MHRLPTQFSSLTPDATAIRRSQFPRNWHLYSTGIIYKFDAQKLSHEQKPDSNETDLPNHKMSNLCVYVAALSAVRHEMKNIFKNLTSTAVNMYNGRPLRQRSIPIPAGKSIDELFKENEFQFVDPIKFPNALSFERMLSVLLADVLGLDNMNRDTKGILELVATVEKVAEQLVSETHFEVGRWRRIQAIPLAFKAFEFDPDSVSLIFEKVELPISIGNKHFMDCQSLSSTFLVSLTFNDDYDTIDTVMRFLFTVV